MLRAPMVATVYDVAQLALGRSAGVSTALAMAARILLSSQRRGALALMAISDFTRREFIRLVGAPQSGPIVVTPLGVDTSWFDAGRQHDARIARSYFVCVGSVRPHKNIERLVQAFARVSEALPHALVVVGLDQMRGAHREWLANLPQGVQSRIRFTGAVEEGELKALIAGADALVFPSLYEGFGLPALEAMAAGCPVLASNAASLPEVCGDAAAEMFDPYSIEQMANVLLRQARRTSAEFKAIVEKGRARAAGFTWDRTADLTAAVIERCIAQADRATLAP
jgi:glycosyltransferase involved in cell wall biosynthesis